MERKGFRKAAPAGRQRDGSRPARRNVRESPYRERDAERPARRDVRESPAREGFRGRPEKRRVEEQPVRQKRSAPVERESGRERPLRRNAWENPARERDAERPLRRDVRGTSPRERFQERPDRRRGEDRPVRQRGHDRPERESFRDRPAPMPRMWDEPADNIIYGVNPVAEAFRAGRGIEKVIVATGRGGKEVDGIISAARGRNIKISFEPRESLTRLARTEGHQGVAAIVSAGRYVDLEDIMEKAERSGEPPFILILDGIQDPQNLGAIIRSAVCAGVHGIIIPKDRAAGLTGAVEKASAGAIGYMSVAKVTNISQALKELKEMGLRIVGMEGGKGKSLYEAPLKGGIGIVIGSEGEGIRPLVAKNCDSLISIPLRGKITSLNASASAAVVMYEVVRQRGGR